ncbi:MAG: sulfite exporter TauE/SafE family protein [Thaumarchaeota archaeon]|nr:sulfite exporter TauE/SafE family protein [Nitrososphaerota archaeon]
MSGMVRIAAAVRAMEPALVIESAAAPDVWMYAGMVALSAGACAVASMVGLAGGLIITPVLMLMGMPPPVAASAGLAATLSSSASSAAAYARQKRIDYRMAIRLGALATPGTILGAVVLADAESGMFGILFAAVLAGSAAYIFLRSKLGGGGISNARLVMVLSASASFMAGIISSFFGIGGGVIFVPLLVAVVGMGMMRAAPTSMLAMLMTSTTAIIMHALLGHTDAVMGLLFAAGGLAGGLAGARISLLMKENHLRAVAAVFLSSIAANLVWDTLSTNAQ